MAGKNAEFAFHHASLKTLYDAPVSTRHISKFTTVSAGARIARGHAILQVRSAVPVPEVLCQAPTPFDLTRGALAAKFLGSDQTFPVELREVETVTSEIDLSFIWAMGMTPPAGRPNLPGSCVTIVASLGSHGDTTSSGPLPCASAPATAAVSPADPAPS